MTLSIFIAITEATFFSLVVLVREDAAGKHWLTTDLAAGGSNPDWLG